MKGAVYLYPPGAIGPKLLGIFLPLPLFTTSSPLFLSHIRSPSLLLLSAFPLSLSLSPLMKSLIEKIVPVQLGAGTERGSWLNNVKLPLRQFRTMMFRAIEPWIISSTTLPLVFRYVINNLWSSQVTCRFVAEQPIPGSCSDWIRSLRNCL